MKSMIQEEDMNYYIQKYALYSVDLN